MTLKDRVEQKKEISRNAIINAAAKVFAEKGPTESTIADIAKESEFSKRTVYLYFPGGKDEILLTVITKTFKLIHSSILDYLARASNPNGAEKIVILTEAFISFASEFPDFFTCIRYKSMLCSIPENTYSDSYGAVLSAIDEGKKDGSIKDNLDTPSLALVLLNILMSITELLLSGTEEVEEMGANVDSVKTILKNTIIPSIETKK